MRLRKQDLDGDMVFGNGASNFWRDQVELVAQSLRTRLLLFVGEWFINTAAGTPWGGFPISIFALEQGKILGEHTQATRDIAITQRVLDTFGVAGITNYSSTMVDRGWHVSMTVQTTYSQNFTLNINSNGTITAII